MIINDWKGELLVIYQMDHCSLAAQFQQHWGNDEFASPEPRAAMAHATYWHDNGWIEYDNKPRMNPDTKRPYRLGELGSAEHLEFYEDGINKVISEDPYAGLMVSMHLTGLYQQRYGMETKMQHWVERSPQKEELRSFIQGIEDGQKTLIADLEANDAYRDPVQHAWLWTNYKFLQVFDRMSLFFCFFSPGITRTFDLVPRDYAGGECEVTMTALDEQRISVDPFPFSEPETVVTLRAKRIADREYADDQDVRITLDAAPFEDHPYTLVPA